LKAAAKKVIIGIIGSLVLLLGIALLVLPGPAFLVIPAGLAILATEFEWAHRWKVRCKKYVHDQREKHRLKKQQREQAYST
jgi:tellurite resistance protein TerC